MRTIVKVASLIITLALLITLTAPAYAAAPNPVLAVAGTTVAPVASVTATTTSAPLMPGDTGTVAVTITNTLKSAAGGNSTVHSSQTTSNYYTTIGGQPVASTVQTTSDQTTSSDGTSGSANIQFVNLIADGPVQVLNGPYTDVGSLGIGDTMTFQFTVKVDSAATDGKYYLPVKVKTDNDGVFINQVVAVVVDSTQPRMVLNDAPSKLGTSKGNIVIDVVNYRTSGINSVSVVPSGDEFSFKPRAEYTVGNIGANEMYTVTFETASKNASYSGSPSFVLKYKNGDNWHQTAPMVVPMESKSDAGQANTGSGSDSTLLIMIVAIVLVLVVIGGIYLFMRSQRSKK